MSPPHIWFDGRYHRQDSIPRGLLEQGLHYGTGTFEGIRAYATDRGPAIFRLDAHMERLERGAEVLGMDLDREAMEDAMHELLRLNGLQSAYIRPIAFYGGGKLHLDVHDLELRQAVATIPWTSHLGEEAEGQGVTMQTSQMRRNSHRAIPALKLCGGYVNAIIAKLAATRAGFDECLFVDDEGLVVEASAENIFLVQGGRLVAVEHPDALPGITRDSIATLAGAERREVTLQELREADEIFLTGTSAEVAPVTRLDDRRLPIGPITRSLQATYQDIVHGRDRMSDGWLTWTGELMAAAK